MPEHRTDHEPEPGRERLRRALVRPSRRQLVVAVLLAVFGFAFVVQVRDTAANDTYAGLRESELVEVLDGLTGTAERARREVDRLEARRDELSDENQARFAALALNLFVFLTAIVFVEPWKRKRLAQTFEKKTEELSAETRALVTDGIGEVKQELHEQVRVLTAMAELALKQEAMRERQQAVEVVKPSKPSGGFLDRAIISGVAAGAVTATIISMFLNS